MAEERRAWNYPGEPFAEVGEESHARHRIWGEIQKTEAKSVHDVTEEIGEGRTQPTREIINEEGVPI